MERVSFKHFAPPIKNLPILETRILQRLIETTEFLFDEFGEID